MEVTKKEESDLILACKRGSRRAYKKVYESYGKSLYLYALRLLHSKDDAEDALQQTFIRFFKGVNNFKGEAALFTYIFRIMVNVCNDFLSHSLKNRNVPLDAANEIFDQTQPNFQLRFQLESAINQLPVKMRKCFVLHHIEGFKIQDIAQLLSVSEGTIKAHLFKAREKLKEMV